MYATTTVGRADQKVDIDYEVSRDGEMEVNEIKTEAGADVSGYISDKDFDYVEQACWNAYTVYCEEAKADAAIARWESRREELAA